MALRRILKEGDEMLKKKSRPIEKIDERVISLLDDLRETMDSANGAGLAAPQVGILKRVIVISIGDEVLELINPEIINANGEQQEVEGCLSIPGIWGVTARPQYVLVSALDRDGNEIQITGEGVLARALCHEIDHLDGVLFRNHVVKYVDTE